jgi:hypothetical protein
MLRSMPAVLLVVALLAGLALPAAAGAQEQQLEPTIIVDSATASAAAPVASTTTLQAGRSYLLVVSGQYTETFPTVGGGTAQYFMDGVYCYDENPPQPQFGCRTRPQVFERSGLTVRLGSPGDGSAENFRPFYAKLGSTTTPPPFVASHRYELRFTPPFGGRLLMAVTRDPNSTYSGTLGVELWGQPVPGDGSTGPSGATSPDLQDLLNNPEGCAVSLATPIALPDDDFCPRRLRARTWNRPGRIAVLEAGDEAVVSSPELSPTQRSATVTLGTTAGDVVVTLSEEDARFRRFSRTACLLVAGQRVRRDLIRSGILEPNAKALMDAGEFLALSGVGRYLVACLRLVDDTLVGSARPVALGLASSHGVRARAAAAGCPVSRVPIRLSASRATSLLHIRAQRKGAPPPTLKVTCLMTRAGLQVRVRPRRPGVSLRKLVGPRLKVGLTRAPESTQTAGPTISFRR